MLNWLKNIFGINKEDNQKENSNTLELDQNEDENKDSSVDQEEVLGE